MVTMSQPASCRSMQRGAHLVGRLAHAEDQVALGDQAVVARRGQHVEAALVAERRPDPLEDPRHRFDVVRQHFWPRIEHLLRAARGSPLKSGISSSTPVSGLSSLIWRTVSAYSHAPPSGRSSRATPVTVAVAQAHRLHALGDPARLVAVEFGGLAGVDLAEVAPTGALLAADQEGGLAVFPALVDVGAAGLLADGVQALAADQALQLACTRGPSAARVLIHGGLRSMGVSRVAHLEAQQLATFGRDGHDIDASAAGGRRGRRRPRRRRGPTRRRR